MKLKQLACVQSSLLAKAPLLLAIVSACSGSVASQGDKPKDRGEDGSDDGATPAPAPEACVADPTEAGCEDSLSRSVVRRLTRSEYNHTVADLLGADIAPAGSFPAEEIVRGFNNNAEALSFPGLLAEQSIAASSGLAKLASGKAGEFAACAKTKLDAACGRQFISSFGKRAWRRPLSSAEVDRIANAFAAGDTPEEGLELAAQAILISAPFFYRVESTTNAPRKPSSWEMASRLSYLLWGSLPDDELFAAAEADKLKDAAQIAVQAQRLLNDPKAMRAFRSFNSQWFELNRIGVIAKDSKAFPAWNSDYPDLLKQSAEAFLDHVVSEGRVGDLFTANYVFVNDDLAPYYGLAKPGSSAFVKLNLNDDHRKGGLLTQGGILAAHAGFASTSPTFRGKFVREQFLCGVIPKAPPDVNVMIGAAEPGQTTREHYSEHIDNPQCSGCHSIMDPIGFAFEEFDAVGQHRTTEHDKPVDASGEAVGSDVGKFLGVSELGFKLAASVDARACIAAQWFRHSYGRLESAADADVLAQFESVLKGDGGFQALMKKTVEARPFMQVDANF